MKRWIVPALLVLFLISLALSARAWLPSLLSFVGANTDLIQGLQALVQLLLWLGAAAVAAASYLRGRPAQPAAPAREQPVQSVETGGGGSFGQVITSGGKVVGRDDVSTTIVITTERIWREFQRGQPKLDLRPATKEYLRCLWDRHCYLSLKGMGVSDRVPLRLPLLDLYVPLKARLELPKGDTWERDPSVAGQAIRLAGRPLSDEEQQAMAGRLGEPQPALELLQKHDGLIVLGDPGAGKTTFLKFLALELALGEGEAVGLGNRLPILAPLSAYAIALSERDVRLDDFIADYFHDIGADLPVGDMLAEALNQGAALILLDGLDEVKEPRLRQTVVDRVVDFYTFHRRKRNKFVLTSRIVGYRDVRPAAADLMECTLVDFEDQEIEGFVARWTDALERQAQGETAAALADAKRERQELLDAIQRNPGVRRLAANPLLLTILALMKRQGVTLPERRVELYDQYVRALLSSWNRARGLGRPPTRDLDVVQTVRILAPLALWMHQVSPGVGLVKREDLRRKLESICQERGEASCEAAAARLLDDVREYAGLLLERGPGEYGFIHLTFEEYLAAVAIALQGQRDIQPIVACLSEHLGDPAWREVSLLTVDYLGIIQQRDQAAGDVVEALIAQSPGQPQAVILAGEAVLDAGPGGVPAKTRDRVVGALRPTMQDAGVPAPLRREAGLLLGRLGWQPDDLDEFAPVLPGKFLYGDEKQEREIAYRYWIAKYPATNAQYARFVEAGGYDEQKWWSKEGWAWREREGRDQPRLWNDLEWNNPIFPVVGVTWFEAEAYANWLNSQPGAVARPKGYVVRLPTEEEWERAARGADGREYPWEGEFNPVNANTYEEPRAGGATAVCTFPQGISSAMVWDMSGNVWEWTMSPWSSENQSPVVRGGSWNDFQWGARCAFRYWFIPDLWDFYFGFRVVVSLALS